MDHNILKCVNLKGKASLNLIEANFLNKYKKKKFDPNFFWINEHIGFHPNNSSKRKALNDVANI